MLLRKLSVVVDQKSWGRRNIPSSIKDAPATHDIDMKKALLMLGTLTLPSLISAASPARFWAWLRYFLAISTDDDLRITRDFSELDPHQKGILSDDLGVALSTQWLFDRFGGFKDIVDGRRFMLQFPDLLLTKAKASTAKVGPSKAPDYVILDKNDKWHVLECKGTQSGPGFRDQFLRDALSQKQVILINGAIRGERLAAGLSISHEDQDRDSNLKIVDPDADPVLTLGPSQEREIKSKVHRLSVARALGMIGLNDSAMELSLPPNVLEAKEYLQRVERRRARAKAEDRSGRASSQLRSRDLPQFEFESQEYEGRSVVIEFPELGRIAPFNTLVVRQGVNRDLLQELSSVSSLFGDAANDRIDLRLHNSTVKIDSDEARATLTYGDVLFSEIILKRT
jgi:hypothetical protein